MDTIPISGLDDLDKHLDDLVQDNNLPLHAKLFDDVELQITEANTPPLIPRLLPRLVTILKTYAQDPAAVVSLTIKLIRPVSFRDVLQLATPDELIQALDSPSPGANILALTVIHKAAARPEDVAKLCDFTDVISAMIRRWLATLQVEVGQKATEVLGDLLDIDSPLPPAPPTHPLASGLIRRRSPGHGRLWPLLFGDKTMYTLLLDLCSGRHPDTSGPYLLSLAQNRLLRLLPRLAVIDFHTVSHSAFTAPTPPQFTNGGGSSDLSFPAPRPGEGILQYAALRMVQRSDPLMHLHLVYFFEALVSLLRVAPERTPAMVETMREVLREATEADEELKAALLTLPERTVPEEAGELTVWLRELMPGVVGAGGEGLPVR